MWHIQKDVFGPHEERQMKDALDNLGIYHCTCVDNQVVDVPTGAWSKDSGPAVFRGSVEFTQSLREQYRSAFGKDTPVCVTPDAYRCSTYYPRWSEYLLNKDHFFVSWATLKQDAQQYFDWMDCEKLFIRPNSGKKIFTGNYITKRWWLSDLNTIASLPGNNPSDKDLVLVSSHKGITSEYRVMMHLDKMISCSYYSGTELQGEGVDSMLERYCYEAAWRSNYYPDDYYTIDVAVMQDGTLKILELNSLFSAGWYDADYEKIIKHVEKHL